MPPAAPTHAPDRADATTTPRVLRRRRPLPNGRAMVGGLLVVLAALLAYAATARAQDGPSTPYVVARSAVAPGEVIAASDLEVVRAELPAGFRGRTFSSPDQVAGAVALAPLAAGDLVQVAALAPSDARVPTLTVSLARADADGGALQPGDLVQVFVTHGADLDAVTRLVSDRVSVVSVGGDDDQLGDTGTLEVRLAVDGAEARSAIINATAAGRLTLVRTTGVGDAGAADSYRPPRGEDR